jgi:hypothetical protein
MTDLGKIDFLKGSLRFKQATDVSIQATIPLSGKIKELDETQRQLSVNLSEVYENERQKSNLFYPSCKFQLIYSNNYSGFTPLFITSIDGNFTFPGSQYERNNDLYYVNAEETYRLQLQSLDPISWPGFLQYNEFTFIRNDPNSFTVGRGDDNLRLNSNLDKANWVFYLSYVSGMDTLKTLSYDFNDGLPGSQGNWVISDGIPYRMKKVRIDGKSVWQFKTAFNHNLTSGEYVQFSNVNVVNSIGLVVPDRNIFEIYSLGDGTFNSDKTIFNILDVGYVISIDSFSDDKTGTFWRIVDNENIEDSRSEYYVRRHTILTNYKDTILTFCGFEQNAFRTKKKYETAILTPNRQSRVSVLEDSQSFNLSFNRTIDTSRLLDNHNRPISELFFTVVNRGLAGYFNPPTLQGNGLKEGWDFNIKSISTSWWERSNLNSDLNLPTLYTGTLTPYYYNTVYNQGDTLYGDVCEWNNLTQTETVLSKYYHKFVHNPQVFNIGTSLENPSGYYYTPHFSLKIKEFSDYIEEGSDVTTDIPSYAYYSQKNKIFYWRDIYTYGFIDSDGNGVDFPFFNGRHYPYNNFVFRIIPEGTNVTNLNVIPIPIVDGCE